MAPVCLCGAALPEKMYGDRAKCKRVDEFGDVTGARGHGLRESGYALASAVRWKFETVQRKKKSVDISKKKKNEVRTVCDQR